jgi:hypothetical protein
LCWIFATWYILLLVLLWNFDESCSCTTKHNISHFTSTSYLLHPHFPSHLLSKSQIPHGCRFSPLTDHFDIAKPPFLDAHSARRRQCVRATLFGTLRGVNRIFPTSYRNALFFAREARVSCAGRPTADLAGGIRGGTHPAAALHEHRHLSRIVGQHD